MYGKCAGRESWPLASHYLHLIQKVSQKMPPRVKRVSSRNASKFSKSRHSSTLGHTKRVVTGDPASGSGSHPQSPRASAQPEQNGITCTSTVYPCIYYANKNHAKIYKQIHPFFYAHPSALKFLCFALQILQRFLRSGGRAGDDADAAGLKARLRAVQNTNRYRARPVSHTNYLTVVGELPRPTRGSVISCSCGMLQVSMVPYVGATK